MCMNKQRKYMYARECVAAAAALSVCVLERNDDEWERCTYMHAWPLLNTKDACLVICPLAKTSPPVPRAAHKTVDARSCVVDFRTNALDNGSLARLSFAKVPVSPLSMRISNARVLSAGLTGPPVYFQLIYT
jgi:hypothetical protein